MAVENSGQRYAPLIENPPEPPLRRRDDDDLIEVDLDSSASEKFAIIWEHRRILRKWVMWGLIIATVLWIVLPRRYESTVRLMPPEASTTGNLMSILGASASGVAATPMVGLAASMLGGKTTGDLYVDVLQGPSVLDPIIDKFDLLKEYHDDYYYQARKTLISRTNVDTNRKSGVITITVTGASQREAQMMAQEYAAQLDRVVRSVSNSDARRERIFLENRLIAVKVELDDASRKLADFASKNSALDVPEQARASVMVAARGQAELAALQAQLEGLRQIYTDNNARVQSLQRQIAELKRQTDMQQTGDVGPDSMMSWMRKLPQLGVQWAEYYRTATVDEVIYEALTKQYEIAKVQEAKETTSVSVLDAPSWPERKSFPKGSIFLPAGLLLSLLLGCGYILALDAYQRVDPTHPAKIYLEDTRARWASRWANNRLRMKMANRGLKAPEDNGSGS